jgi:hypothetical protein
MAERQSGIDTGLDRHHAPQPLFVDAQEQANDLEDRRRPECLTQNRMVDAALLLPTCRWTKSPLG